MVMTYYDPYDGDREEPTLEELAQLEGLTQLEKLRGLRQLTLFGCCRTAPRELARRE